MKLAVHLEPPPAASPVVEYNWDPDTDILSAHIRGWTAGGGMSGSVGLEGADGSWVILDVSEGRINAVEVAVWPEVQHLASLSPPDAIEDAGVLFPGSRSKSELSSIEVDTKLSVSSNAARSTYHFQLGKTRGTKTVRLARDILLDLDGRGKLTGFWLLNVPPCPIA